jgi:hypothetical protein
MHNDGRSNRLGTRGVVKDPPQVFGTVVAWTNDDTHVVRPVQVGSTGCCGARQLRHGLDDNNSSLRPSRPRSFRQKPKAGTNQNNNCRVGRDRLELFPGLREWIAPAMERNTVSVRWA